LKEIDRLANQTPHLQKNEGPVMSRIRKALERSQALRAKNKSDLAWLINGDDMVQFTDSGDMDRFAGCEDPTLMTDVNDSPLALAVPQKSRDVALSEREQLEYDISELLRKEFPEDLDSRQKQIRLSYTKTKTIRTDRKTLLRNRVFTHVPDLKITEQIEMLRFQVLKQLDQLNGNCLMVTSANPGEGKTFISTNLALSMAQVLDRTVMLIDANLRNRSRRHQGIADVFYNSYKGAGLSDYLLGTAKISDVLINPGIARLTLMPGGQGSLDSPALLESAKMEALISEMKSRYSTERIILFDASSFLPNADALVLSRFMDAVLVVVESEKTRIDAVTRTIDLLSDKPVIGTVMNKYR
jgi:non-specific protein-tyrosine kinase